MPNRNEQRPEEPKQAPRVSFLTLGCRLNKHDTAAMRADLESEGWRATEPHGADVLIVSTCTVTRRADQEARQLVRRLGHRVRQRRVARHGLVLTLPSRPDILRAGRFESPRP